MNSEGGYQGPSKKERESIAKVHTDADPTQYSQLSPQDMLSDTGREADKDHENHIYEAEGSHYVKMGEQVKLQQFVSRLLKGIVNVSDVISQEKDGERHYFSRILPVEKIEKETPDSEVKADIYLLSALLDDGDHNIAKKGISRDHNLFRAGGRTTYFDFAQATSFFNKSRNAHYMGEVENITDPEILNVLQSKVTALQERIAGPEGLKFITSISAPLEDIRSIFYALQDGPGDYRDQADLIHEELDERLSNIYTAIRRAREKLPK